MADLPPIDALLGPQLSAAQLEVLRRHGEVRSTVAGQVLFREGDRGHDFIVILSGAVMVVDHQTGVERELVRGGPGEFSAELSLLTGERVFTTAVVAEAGSILVVPVDRLRTVLDQDQALADVIVQTAFRRRQLLVQARTGMRIIGSRFSADTRRLREFVARNRLPHVFLDIDADHDAAQILDYRGVCPNETPIVVMRGGELLRNPSNAELARAAGFGSAPAPDVVFDVAVVGAGPAGLAAAVYGASEGLVTVAMDGRGVGGQIGTTPRIENYLGFPLGVSGEEFAERALIQVLRFGATLLVPAAASGLQVRDGKYVVELDGGDELVARSVIIATGVTYRKLDAVGLERFEGLGVFYTPLTAQNDIGPGDAVVIVGGGNSAGQAATFLAARGHPVTIVIRGDNLATTMSQYLIDRIAQQGNIVLRQHSAVEELEGVNQLERVVIKDLASHARHTIDAAALFVLIGAEPHTKWLRASIELDDSGFIITGANLSPQTRQQQPWKDVGRDPYLLETSLPGVFAAGDVRSGSVKRVASAVGDGSIAVRFVSEYLGSPLQLEADPAGRPRADSNAG